MAQILPRELPPIPGGTINPAAAIIVDNDDGVFKATPTNVVDAGAPVNTQPEAEAGLINTGRMSPLRVAQAIAALGLSADVLAAPTGSTLVGRPTGTVDTALDGIESLLDTSAQILALGAPNSASRLTVSTVAAELMRGVDIYHKSDQTAPSNQYPAFTIHNYTDGNSAYIDTVGDKVGLTIRQARNPAARPDKPSTYVGDGIFLDIQRSRVSGGGNLGTGNDRLCMIDAQGCFTSYGPNAADWSGGSGDAPIKLGTYTGFLSKLLYMGFNYASDKAIIGSIDTGVGAFKPLDIAASALRPIGDNAVSLGASSLRFTYVHAFNVRTHDVTVATLPNSVTAGAGTRAFVSDSSVAASGNFGAIVAGGGANAVPVFSDGAQWRIG